MEDTELQFINPYKLFFGAFVPNWLLERKEVSHGAKLCYAKLCQYAGKDGICFPKQEKIANNIGLESRRQSIRLIQELESYNLIFTIKPGKKCVNRYKFLYHPWMGDVTFLSHHNMPNIPKMSHHNIPKMSLPIEIESKEESIRESSTTTNTNTRAHLKKSFENFWKEYPKKRSKGQAEKVWLKIMSGESPVEERTISQAVLRAKTSADWQKENGRYIPHPATWLNARGWEDEIQTGKEETDDARFNFLKQH